MSIVGIKAKIVEQLESLDEIRQVFVWGVDFINGDIVKFPIAVVLPSGNESNFLSSRDNIRVYPYDIFLVVNVESTGEKDGQEKIEALTDLVVDHFDKASVNTLGGEVLWINPVTSGFTRAQISTSRVALISKVVLKCNKDFNIYQ